MQFDQVKTFHYLFNARCRLSDIFVPGDVMKNEENHLFYLPVSLFDVL